MTAIVVYAVALTLTIGSEAVVSALFGFRTKREFAILALTNGVTHPLLWVLVLNLSQLSDFDVFWQMLLVLELLVVLAEFALLRWALPAGRRRLLVQAFVMNAASAIMGLFLLR